MTQGLSTDQIAAAVARDLPDGSCVNLGIGMPLRVASYVPAGHEIVFHSENGILGVGPPPEAGEEDWNLIDAGKNAITLVCGGSYVSHADSFCVVRGGYIDVAVMGAYQVSGHGDLANWWTGEGLPGVGGAMDLGACAKQVFIMMRHNECEGGAKLVESCTLPLTALGSVTRVYTELGIFSPHDGILTVHALAPGCDLDLVQARTALPVRPASEGSAIPVVGPVEEP